MSGTVVEDYYGHRNPTTAPALTAGAISTSVAGTISPTTSAGSTATVSGVSATDNYGTFTINSAGTGQAAGAAAYVAFANPFGAAPKTVQVNVTTAAGTTAIAAAATSITASGFNVTTAILTASTAYTVSYQVLP